MSDAQSSKTVGEQNGSNDAKTPPPVDQIVETQHTIRIHNQEIPYTVTCGTIVLKRKSRKKAKKRAKQKAKSQKPKFSLLPIFAMMSRIKLLVRSHFHSMGVLAHHRSGCTWVC